VTAPTATRSAFNDSPGKEAPAMYFPAKEITESYRYLRGECAAASELIEALAEFDILCVHLDGSDEIHVDLNAAGLPKLQRRIYALQAAELLGLDYFDRAAGEWRGMWNGVWVAVRAYAPAGRRPFRDWLRDLIEARS
jgi:hypothetical protein